MYGASSTSYKWRTDDIAIATAVRNPAVAQGKGQPNNAPNRGKYTQAGSKRLVPRNIGKTGTYIETT